MTSSSIPHDPLEFWIATTVSPFNIKSQHGLSFSLPGAFDMTDVLSTPSPPTPPPPPPPTERSPGINWDVPPCWNIPNYYSVFIQSSVSLSAMPFSRLLARTTSCYHTTKLVGKPQWVFQIDNTMFQSPPKKKVKNHGCHAESQWYQSAT